jgi:predicted RNA methylase
LKQFKRDENQKSNKLHMDKYYTPPYLAEYIVNKTKEIIGEENITEWLEPSAGAGVFLNCLPEGTLAYDIEPEDDRIVKQDFLELNLKYKKGRCIIGNPPFGSGNTLAVQFFKKSIQLSNYISFILPISQINNTQQMYEFDLIYSENLNKQKYTDREIHCCFNIYKRPADGKLNQKKKYNFKDFKLIEKREGKKQNKKYPNDNYDFRICTWGASCGKILETHESYAKEVAFYINNKNLNIYETIKKMNIHKDFHMTSTPSLSLWQIYEYLQNKIPELQ